MGGGGSRPDGRRLLQNPAVEKGRLSRTITRFSLFVVVVPLRSEITERSDQSFSGKPGGGFIGLFDEEGDGIKHAAVIGSQKPRRINFEGPPPCNGLAVNKVYSVVCIATEDGAGFDVDPLPGQVEIADRVLPYGAGFAPWSDGSASSTLTSNS